MKHLLITLCLLQVIVATGQNLPLTKGHIYYRFHDTLPESDVCINKFFSGLEFMKLSPSVTEKAREYTTREVTNWSYKTPKTLYLGLPAGIPTGTDCTDTAKGGGFVLGVPHKAKFHEYMAVYKIATLSKEKVLSQVIKATIDLEFLSQNEYIVKIKGYTLSTTYSNGRTEEQPLSKVYQAYLSDPGKAKGLHNLFAYVDEASKETLKIIQEVITEKYEAETLD